MAKLRRIALFAEGSPLFINVLMGLRDGFAACGVETHVGWPLPTGPQLNAFIGNFAPDAIFEINRSRNQIHGCDHKIFHISWIHDFQYGGRRLLEYYGGSSFYYYMHAPDTFGIDPDRIGPWRYLWPGVNPKIHCPAPASLDWDMTLVGHMYPPLSERLTQAVIEVRGSPVGTLGEFADVFNASPIGFAEPYIGRIRNLLAEFCRRKGVLLDPADIDPQALFLFDDVLYRIKERCAGADAMLSVSKETRFFGTPGWALWPAYAPYYGGEITDPRDLAAVYRASRLNVHRTGWPYHFRTLEAMGCGGVVMINRVRHLDVERRFHADFVPGEHYIEYEPEAFAEVARQALRDAGDRSRIAEAAARRIVENHTWRHRAMQIIADIEQA